MTFDIRELFPDDPDEPDPEYVEIATRLLPAAASDLEDAAALTYENRATVINRAIRFYAHVHRIQDKNGKLYVRDKPDGPLYQLRVL